MDCSFLNDYGEGAHPKILEALLSTNQEVCAGYGMDPYCNKAQALLLSQVGNSKAHIHFVSGGTQANLLVTASMLRPHESLIAADTGHVAVHETGAIEATGHKVSLANSINGKLLPEAIEAVVKHHHDEHMVKPRMVYISNCSELGTCYTLGELREIKRVCTKYDLLLYLDGARLGTALASVVNDISLSDLGTLVDVFYIGGTKNGALFGEAVVVNRPELAIDFRYHMKQRGALLAKGKVLGLQFCVLFEDGLYWRLAKKANESAMRVAKALSCMGVEMPDCNQVFARLPNEMIEKLAREFSFHIWTMGEKESLIRLVTSWATTEEAICALEKAVEKICTKARG